MNQWYCVKMHVLFIEIIVCIIEVDDTNINYLFTGMFEICFLRPLALAPLPIGRNAS